MTIVRDGGALRCTLCGPLGPSDKAAKQHLKSITHKRALAAANAATPAARRPTVAQPPEDASAEVCELLEALGLASLPAGADAARQFAQYVEARNAIHSFGLPVSGALPPQLLRNPAKECPRLDFPFLTEQTGAIPTIPSSLDACLAVYFSGRRDAFPKVDVAEAGISACTSWADARRALQAADAAGDRYWCTFLCDRMKHPRWWPKGAKGSGGVGPGRMGVPLYDQVIVGSGQTGIGIHRDVHGAGRRPVCTCLCLARGVKHVMLLPPTCAEPWLLAGGAPPKAEAVQALVQLSAEGEAVAGTAKRGAGECAWFGDDDVFPKEPSPQLLGRIASVGGYFFSLHSAEAPSGREESPDCEEAEGAVLALFIPAGWFHWLLGEGDWHCIFGGSFFPTAQIGGAALGAHGVVGV